MLGGHLQARRGELVDVLEGGAGAGLVAMVGGTPVGLVTWHVGDGGSVGSEAAVAGAGPATDAARAGGAVAEVRALAVGKEQRGAGIGRALLEAAGEALRAAGVRRAWLVTTNDNLGALALYQKAGWRLSALRPGALADLRRRVKPSIPEVGEHGIPLRDELELSLEL